MRLQDYSDPSPSANLVGRLQDVLAVMESSFSKHAGARFMSCFDEHAIVNRFECMKCPRSTSVQFFLLQTDPSGSCFFALR